MRGQENHGGSSEIVALMLPESAEPDSVWTPWLKGSAKLSAGIFGLRGEGPNGPLRMAQSSRNTSVPISKGHCHCVP